MQRVGQAYERFSSTSDEDRHHVGERIGRVGAGRAIDVLMAAAGAGLTGMGLMRRGTSGMLVAAAGATLGAVGLSRMTRRQHDRPVSAIGAITIDAPRREVYCMWRQPERMRRFMRHVIGIEEHGDGRMHWRMRLSPGTPDIEWDTEIVEDRSDERIAWRTLEGDPVEHQGSVRFVDAPGGRGTEVHARLTFHPRGAAAGTAIARLTHPFVEHQLKDDLRRLKWLMETGEIPVAVAQPQGD